MPAELVVQQYCALSESPSQTGPPMPNHMDKHMDWTFGWLSHSNSESCGLCRRENSSSFLMNEIVAKDQPPLVGGFLSIFFSDCFRKKIRKLFSYEYQ